VRDDIELTVANELRRIGTREVELDEARVRPAASEVERLISDPSLAKELTGWSAEVELRDGLARTLDWIASNTQRFRASDYVI